MSAQTPDSRHALPGVPRRGTYAVSAMYFSSRYSRIPSEPALAAETALLDAAERRGRVTDDAPVDGRSCRPPDEQGPPGSPTRSSPKTYAISPYSGVVRHPHGLVHVVESAPPPRPGRRSRSVLTVEPCCTPVQRGRRRRRRRAATPGRRAAAYAPCAHRGPRRGPPPCRAPAPETRGAEVVRAVEPGSERDGAANAAVEAGDELVVDEKPCT